MFPQSPNMKNAILIEQDSLTYLAFLFVSKDLWSLYHSCFFLRVQDLDKVWIPPSAYPLFCISTRRCGSCHLSPSIIFPAMGISGPTQKGISFQGWQLRLVFLLVPKWLMEGSFFIMDYNLFFHSSSGINYAKRMIMGWLIQSKCPVPKI